MVLLGVLANVPTIPGTKIDLTVPYAAEGPGPTYNTLDQVDGKPIVDVQGAQLDPTSGHLNMTTVSVRTQLTLAQAAERWLVEKDTLVPIEQLFPKNKSTDEVNQDNQAQFASSESAATISAMNYLHKRVVVGVKDVVEGSPAEGQLNKDDLIDTVDGEHLTSPTQIQQKIRAKKPGDKVDLRIVRGNQTMDKTLALAQHGQDGKIPFMGVLMEAQPADGIKVNYNLNDVGGPSAGMMFSLAVVDKLSPGELNGGRFVAGTGTIDEDGKVGPIGGISHKMDAAESSGAELFLAPADNCTEVQRQYHGKLNVAKVSTLADSVHAMEAFNKGESFPTCN